MLNLIMITLVYFVGLKFWRSTRKIKVISQSDHSAFRGKIKMPEFSDSDSDFETIAPNERVH